MVSVSRPHHKRVRALVECKAVTSDQLAFFKDEIIVVTGSSDPHWWVGYIEGDTSRSGTFPVNYVLKTDMIYTFSPRATTLNNHKGLKFNVAQSDACMKHSPFRSGHR
ncbi:hypothetical protein WMY93_016598 [Mugilogobius chulae]|uniref:SH3 domain-containing protein n=1 Tax=Mugilogobius chulae TaxID=88201 RepID=A0AAW0NL91_9GOBI